MSSKIRLRVVLLLIISITVFIYSFSMIEYTSSKYNIKKDGNVSSSIGKPICNVIVDNNNINITNYTSESLQFSVNNYDKNNNVSDVAMEYSISFNISQIDAPLTYELYKIDSNRNKEKIETIISNGTIKEVKSSTLKAGSSQTERYELKIDYDYSSNIKLDSNFKIDILVDSKQIRPVGI